tara:strand:+ start:9216 stop:9338 length:123 start_codon:yes stop_codon:yes gene_type:complete
MRTFKFLGTTVFMMVFAVLFFVAMLAIVNPDLLLQITVKK